MKWTTLVLLSVAVTAYCQSSSETSEGCGDSGCIYIGGMDDIKQGNLMQRPYSDICIFRGMPVNCNKFLRIPCIFSNTGPSSWSPFLPQGGRGSRVKRQVAGATSISSTRGWAYPFGLYGGYPFMGGYGSYYG